MKFIDINTEYKIFKKVRENFYYNSKNNDDFLKGNSLINYLKKNSII